MFQIEQAKELDFGIYRIMNYRREEIEKFLEQDLLPQVRAALNEYVRNDSASLKERMKELETKAKEAGFESIEELPQSNKIRVEYEELKQKLTSSIDIDQAEVEVFSALLNFFKRYYDKGDFISQRRYKEGVYAIPYEGEEVKLYWANHDQYYIKTTENFRDYSFKIFGDKIVHFRLVEAETEKDNNKEQPGKERRFILCDEDFITIENGELIIRFEYRVDSDKQENHNKQAVERIFKAISSDKRYNDFLMGLLEKAPTEKNPNRTVLEKHLTNYTAKNTFDYFIHKDLEGFLKRELDFYIKTEIMRLDDLDTENEAKVNTYLAKIKAIKRIGHKIIDFLAQIENFQKNLWLKKKFVVETNYCITLDRIPEKFYPEIAANDAQREEWVRLFAIDEIEGDLINPGYTVPLTEEFLKANKYLVLDTKFFSNDFKERLIASIDSLDEKIDGLLIQSENFQALNMLSEKYKENVKCIYIDPPYNTSEETFIYKNNFKHSSWMSMIVDRVKSSFSLMSNDGALLVTIDDEELYNLKMLLDRVSGNDKYVGTLVIQSNPRGRGINSYFATCHEYCLCYAKKPEELLIIDQPLTEEQESEYRHHDDISAYRLLPFRRSGGLSTPDERPNSEFAIYFSVEKGQIIGVGGERLKPYPALYEPSYVLYLDEAGTIKETDLLSFKRNNPGIITIMPVDSNGERRVWRWSDREKILQAVKMGDFVVQKNGSNYTIYLKDRIKEGRKPKTMWTDSRYDSSSHGTNLLQNLFGERRVFGYPKSLYSTMDSIYCIVGEDKNAICLDFFAGSGTTGHAVIELNRNDQEKSKRKYILVEMGTYFDTVLKPRMQKVIYSKEWKNGKPLDREGISHMFKYMKLESYDDTLNNIEVNRTDNQQMVLDLNAGLKEQYYLYYMLDQETANSPSLLNIDMFQNPFEYKMKIADGFETKITNIDLVETFNYLIGLNVQHMGEKEYFNVESDSKASYEGAVKLVPDKEGPFIFKTIEGTLRSGEKVLVIWRTMTGDIEKDNAALDAYLKKKQINTKDFEYDIIYVNGDNNLQNLKLDEEHWKVVLIEEEFKKRMFDVRDI